MTSPSWPNLRGKAFLGVALALVIGSLLIWFLQVEGPEGERAEQPERSPRTNSGALQISAEIVSLTTSADQQQSKLTQARLDPSRDGWETEVVAESAKSHLKRIAKLSAKNSDDSANNSWIAKAVKFDALRPEDLAEPDQLANLDQIVVLRSLADDDMKLKYQGRAAFLKSLAALTDVYPKPDKRHLHIKVIRVSLEGDSASTVAYFEADGRSDAGRIQQRATWHCTWKRLSGKSLQLTSLRVADYEEVLTGGTWMVDSTEEVLAGNASYQKQLRHGLNHWLTRLERIRGMHVFARNGLALGDVNGDGLDDVYVCQPGGLPNRLYVHQPDGTAVDRSREAGVDWLEQTSSALFLDLDNDGDQDLAAATVAGLLLMENDGSGKFLLRATLATNDTDTQSFSAADYDNDGDLDLYVCIEFARQLTLQYQSDETFVYHDANDGAANILFRNDSKAGEWQFTDVTKQVGLDVDNRRHSLACAWEDFDNDGDQDLYVANDYGKNCLYRNNDGRFENIAAVANAVDSASGMSVSWGDYNRDGFMDLYVANMFSSAGNRITTQEQFRSGGNPSLRDVYSRFSKGNTLLQNTGNGTFEDVGADAGVEMGRWAWSSVFADLNNDAWDDLLVANGYITTEDTGDL